LTVETNRIGRLATLLFGAGELSMGPNGYWYWVTTRGPRVALGFSLPDAEALIRKRLQLRATP
jgi:hypothetical protein